MAVDISGISYFLPIFSFLLVFIIVYAILKKTEVLGGDSGVALFVSLILASFFIVNAQMVEFVEFSASWFVVFLICILFILMFLAFVSKDYLKVFTENKGLAVAFIASASRVFQWAINWDATRAWFETDWFGMILLLVIAGIVAAVIAKKK